MDLYRKWMLPSSLFMEVNKIEGVKEAYIHVDGRLRSPLVSLFDQIKAHENNKDRNPFCREPPVVPKDLHPFSRQELKKYFGTKGN